jgi:hypothetical protein
MYTKSNILSSKAMIITYCKNVMLEKQYSELQVVFAFIKNSGRKRVLQKHCLKKCVLTER